MDSALNSYIEERVCFGDESESGITTPTSSTIVTFACSSPTATPATTPMSIPISAPLAQLQVSPTSDLAGYSYETSAGRYATFFWQDISSSAPAPDGLHNERSSPQGQPDPNIDKHIKPGSIYASNFLKKDPSWVLTSPPIPVAMNAKQNTPVAAVTWSNGLKAAVYYLDQRNIICERVSNNGGNSWSDGTLTTWAVPTRSNSDLAAVVTWKLLKEMEIHVYFQDEENCIRDLKFDCSGWHEQKVLGTDLLKGLSGTSLACANESTYDFKRWIYVQSAERDVVQFMYQHKLNSWRLDLKKDYFSQRFDRRVRLGYCADRWYLNIFVHDGSNIRKTTWQRGTSSRWLDEKVLLTSTGTAKVLQNFIVLNWPADEDYTSSEIHFFSMEEGILWDYLMGPATGSSVHLVMPQA